MTNALVLFEACSICGLVQRVYLGRRSRRRTPRVCASCSRPWIRWVCQECGTANHEQVDALPVRGGHCGLCSACGRETDPVDWAHSSLVESEQAKKRTSGRSLALTGTANRFK